jgi:hypothetical protein
MAFLIGLLLAPIGAAIGSFLFFVAILFQGGPPFDPWDFARIVAFGTAIGMIPATPVSAFLIPAAYYFRLPFPGPRKLALLGAIFGFVVSGGLLLSFWIQGNQDKDLLFWAIIFGVGLDGAIAGAFCGAMLGLIMRRWRTGTGRQRALETPA